MYLPSYRSYLTHHLSFIQRIIPIISFYHSPSHYHIKQLQTLFKSKQILNHNIQKYTIDWTKHYHGGSIVCLPSSTHEVSCMMKYCYDHNIAVVPQGGNTSLVGGSVGINDELIISTEHMNKIYEIDAISGVIVCDAGCILQDLMDAVAEKGCMIPLDLGAKGSCAIGGNVATNAGGLKLLRYGSMHENVLGLEVVLADGTVLDMLRVLRKDNCGYPLKHMFIGSEGTLGIITKVALSLAPLPRYTSVVLAKVSSFDVVCSLLSSTKKHFSEVLSAFEFMDSSAISAVREVHPNLVNRFSTSMFPRDTNSQGLYVLLETASNVCSESESDRLMRLFEPYLSSGQVIDATISSDKTQEQETWSIRELIPTSLAHISRNTSLRGPFLLKYDVSVPLTDMLKLADDVCELLKADGYTVLRSHDVPAGCSHNTDLNESLDTVFGVYCYGHAGDQNLHLNVLLSLLGGFEDKDILSQRKNEAQRALDKAVVSSVVHRKGSISAEHGIGQQKVHVIEKNRTPEEMAVMRSIKATLDPKNILNPNKVFTMPNCSTSCKEDA